MSSRDKQRQGDAQAPPLSSSPLQISQPDPKPEPDSPTRPGYPIKRSSSVRFSEELPETEAEMPERDQSRDVDEVTPIRKADSQAQRTYNATEERVNTGTSSAHPARPSDVASEAEQKQSWLKGVLEKYGSVSLENKGSVARDHLALERTFLAWLRTSLAFASIGIAVTQLFRLNTSIQTRAHNPPPSELQLQTLPLSPLVGHGLPVELIPFLQQLALSGAQPLAASIPSNTLLDQLLSPQPADAVWTTGVQPFEFNEHAATRLRRVGKPLGATFIGISIIVLLVGFHRYFESQFWIIRGKFPASRGSVAFVGLIAGALIVASLIIVLVVAPISFEKR